MVDKERRRLTVGMTSGVAGPSLGGGRDAFCLELMKKEGFEKITCVHSVTDAALKKTKGFAEKNRAGCEKGAVVENGKIAEIPGSCFTCRKGLKPESPNQDSFVVIGLADQWNLYGVFDGHGPNGHDVSNFAVQALVMDFFEQKYVEDPAKAFQVCFVNCQEKIKAQKSEGLDSTSSGSTCTMAFHDLKKDTLTIAHVGDSRGVLISGAALPIAVEKETEDHKPSLPGEKKRIEAAGGRVVFDGYYNHRVFAAKGMYPGLNMSRALGDTVAHAEAGLTAEPEINIVELKSKRDKLLTLMLCSDGVWEFVQSGQAADFLTEPGKKEIKVDQARVDALAKKSWDEWMADSDNEISDDITVVAVTL